MKKDLWSGVFFLILAGFGIACTIDVRESMIQLPGDSLGATGFPRIFGFVLCALSLVAAGRAFFLPAPGIDAGKLTKNSWALILVSSGYILGISFLGFTVSTLVYLFLTSAIFVGFDRGKLRGILVYSVVVTAIAFTFFKVFKVYLPDTILF